MMKIEDLITWYKYIDAYDNLIFKASIGKLNIAKIIVSESYGQTIYILKNPLNGKLFASENLNGLVECKNFLINLMEDTNSTISTKKIYKFE